VAHLDLEAPSAKTAAEEADPGLVVRVVTSLRRDGEHDAVLSGLGVERLFTDVQHVDPKAWTLDWDLPPRPEDVNRFDLRREAEEIGGEPPPRR
jgi:hypothetical protein